MAIREQDDSMFVTVQTKISYSDSSRLDAEVERRREADPGGGFTRSSVLRGWLLAGLEKAEKEDATPKKKKTAVSF